MEQKEQMLLKDPDIYPSAEVLEKELGAYYPVLSKFMDAVISEEFGFNPEWRYYRDGKAWLCKITCKSKTVAWMSVWPGYFRVVFYFTEKTGVGIPGLGIPEELKEQYRNHPAIGKLKPLIFEVEREDQLNDVYSVLGYKAGTL